MYYSEEDSSRPSTRGSSAWGPPGSVPSDEDPLASSPTTVRQQKLYKQRALMEQKKKERRMQTGMVVASGGPTATRPVSRGTRRSSRPAETHPPGTEALGGSQPLNNEKSAVAYAPPLDPSLTFSNPVTVMAEKPVNTKSQEITKKLESLGIASSVDFNDEEEEEEEEDDDQCGDLKVALDEAKGPSSPPPPALKPLRDPSEKYVLKENLAEAKEARKRSIVSRHSNARTSGTAVGAAAMDLGYDINDLDTFVNRPAPHGQSVQCRLTRDTRGLDKKKYPWYYLHLERNDGKKIFLLAARRRKKSKTSNYIISTDPTDLARDGESYKGKLRSNFMGTQFTVYDSGVNPLKGEALPDNSNVREELAAIIYETNVFGIKGPRKMSVLIPAMGIDREKMAVKPTKAEESLLERWKRSDMRNLLCLRNKTPQWNDETQSYVLNFHGRVTKASVKNFQIIHSEDPDYIVMQFGRVSEDVFSMDFNYPVNAIQAFAITLSSFDSKLACE